MKNWMVLIFLVLSIVFYAGCKNDDDPDPTPTVDTYSVTYSLSVFGGYDSLEISYFAPHDMRRIKLNPKTPWTVSMTDYRKLDSVALNVAVLPLPNGILNYEWEVRISKGGDLIDLNSADSSGSTGENPPPVYINWNQIIE